MTFESGDIITLKDLSDESNTALVYVYSVNSDDHFWAEQDPVVFYLLQKEGTFGNILQSTLTKIIEKNKGVLYRNGRIIENYDT